MASETSGSPRTLPHRASLPHAPTERDVFQYNTPQVPEWGVGRIACKVTRATDSRRTPSWNRVADARDTDGIQIAVNRLHLPMTCGNACQPASPLLAYTAVVLAQNSTHSFIIHSFSTLARAGKHPRTCARSKLFCQQSTYRLTVKGDRIRSPGGPGPPRLACLLRQLCSLTTLLTISYDFSVRG